MPFSRFTPPPIADWTGGNGVGAAIVAAYDSTQRIYIGVPTMISTFMRDVLHAAKR